MNPRSDPGGRRGTLAQHVVWAVAVVLVTFTVGEILMAFGSRPVVIRVEMDEDARAVVEAAERVQARQRSQPSQSTGVGQPALKTHCYPSDCPQSQEHPDSCPYNSDEDHNCNCKSYKRPNTWSLP